MFSCDVGFVVIVVVLSRGTSPVLILHAWRDVLDLRFLRESAQEHLLTDGSADRFRHRPGWAPRVFSANFLSKSAIPEANGATRMF